MPKRIQRKRIKGWRMPKNTIYVGRPTQWGNPFDWKLYQEANDNPAKAKEHAKNDYLLWLENDTNTDPRRAKILNDLHTLRGKNLACWCKPNESCHADVLLDMANLRR